MTKYARLRKQVINRCGEIGIALTQKSARVGDPYKDVGAFKAYDRKLQKHEFDSQDSMLAYVSKHGKGSEWAKWLAEDIRTVFNALPDIDELLKHERSSSGPVEAKKYVREQLKLAGQQGQGPFADKQPDQTDEDERVKWIQHCSITLAPLHTPDPLRTSRASAAGSMPGPSTQDRPRDFDSVIDEDLLRANLLEYDFTDSEINLVLPLLANCQKRKTEFLLRLKPSQPKQFRGLKGFRIEARNRLNQLAADGEGPPEVNPAGPTASVEGGDGKDTPVASSTSSEHRAGHEGKACTANEKRVPAEQATASKPAAVKRGPSQDLDTSTGPGKRPKQSDHRKSASQPAAFPVGNFAAAEKIQASSGSEASSEDESSNKQKQGLDAHTYLKDAIIGLAGLEAQRQNSTVFGEGGIARLQGSIGIWESVGAHTEVISMRAKLVELEQNAALDMSRDYGVILAGLYKWIEDKHPKDALAMWSAAAGACGSRTASPA
ncbi:hypothetical protein WJX82_007907 [Trebouxia sp. C0006]